jgi:beta-carotene/zeaxanthin 4-ketolase
MLAIAESNAESNAELNRGVLIALFILLAWVISLMLLASVQVAQFSFVWILLLVMGRTFLHTGLFIVAHDAIHGAVFPKNRQINGAIGRLALSLYAFLLYKKCALNHWRHHRKPGGAGDPDFHNGVHRSVLAWYLRFMSGYLEGIQKVILLIGMGAAFGIFTLGFQVPIANLFLFWILPIFLSSIQLFFFGTYLPHRGHPNPQSDLHCATSSNYPVFWSLLTCYHFGYHWEHHEYPSLPWYQLPLVYENRSKAL